MQRGQEFWVDVRSALRSPRFRESAEALLTSRFVQLCARPGAGARALPVGTRELGSQAYEAVGMVAGVRRVENKPCDDTHQSVSQHRRRKLRYGGI